MSASKLLIVIVLMMIFIISCSKGITKESDLNDLNPSDEGSPTIACSKDSDCGETSSRDVCYQKATVYRETTRNICSNPGTAASRCTSDSSQVIVKDCDIREVCDNGKCIIPPPSKCEETDDGIDKENSGYVKIGTEMYKDQCLTSGTLQEAYCSDNNTLAYTEISCSKGCSGSECND